MCRRLGVNLSEEFAKESEYGSFDWTLGKLSSTLESVGLTHTMAEFFVVIGDVISLLYTNSCAMHSAMIRDYAHPPLQTPPINALIAIQRRVQNLYLDTGRQTGYDMLLGTNQFQQQQSPAPPLAILTAFPAFVPKPIPALIEMSPNGLLSRSESICWIVPGGVDLVELWICLWSFSRVKEICLTIGHGVNDETTPVGMDMYVGQYLDSQSVILQGLRLPSAADGTPLWFPISENPLRLLGGMGHYNYEAGNGL
jgi:hypothetical protein